MLGALYTAAAVGGLVGPPIVGAVIDGVSYDAGIVIAMVITAVATVVLFMLPAGHDRAWSGAADPDDGRRRDAPVAFDA